MPTGRVLEFLDPRDFCGCALRTQGAVPVVRRQDMSHGLIESESHNPFGSKTASSTTRSTHQ